jgi:hypothetical protein
MLARIFGRPSMRICILAQIEGVGAEPGRTVPVGSTARNATVV